MATVAEVVDLEVEVVEVAVAVAVVVSLEPEVAPLAEVAVH